MNLLRKKISLAALLFLGVLLFSFFFILRATTLSQVKAVELSDNNKEMNFAIRSIHKDVKSMDLFLVDWSQWDDTYKFIQGIDKEAYIRSNLITESLLKQRYDFWVFLDENKNLFYGIEVDHKKGTTRSIPKNTAAFFTTDDMPNKTTGLFVMNGKTYLFASRPILDNLAKKPPKGIMILLQPWDISMIESEYKDEVTFSTKMLTDEEKSGLQNITQEAREIVRLDSGAIVSSLLIKDVSDKPAFLIEAETKRLTNLYAKKQFNYILLYLSLAYIIFATAVIMLTKKILRLQQQVFQAGKMASIGTLGAGLAHELNNPLSVISGFVQNLKLIMEERKIQDDPAISECLEKITTNAGRMKKIVDNIRMFSKTPADSVSLKVDDINTVVNNSVMLLEKQLEAHKIKLTMDLEPELPRTLVDSVKLQTALQNLIINAREELDEHKDNQNKEISIRTSQGAHSTIRIVVEDNGRGISEKDIGNIFDMFYSTKGSGVGTGMGLPTTYGIIRDLMGTIDVSSVKSKGTTFTIKLPVTRERK
jgi:signal transduction histidine kinase